MQLKTDFPFLFSYIELKIIHFKIFKQILRLNHKKGHLQNKHPTYTLLQFYFDYPKYK